MTFVNTFSTVRCVGSFLLIAGYFVLLNIDVAFGLSIRVVANFLTLPWAISNKLWDVVVLLAFFMAIELHKLVSLIISF